MISPLRSEFSTTDIDEACAAVSAAYSRVRLSVLHGGENFRFSQVVHDLGPVRIDRHHTALATKATGDPVGRVIIYRVLDHVVELDAGNGFRRFGPGDVFVCQRPDVGYQAIQFGASGEAVSTDRQFLQQVAVADPERPITLPEQAFGQPLAPPAARAWQHAMRYVSRGVLAHATAAASPMLVDSARRVLAATVLTVLDALPEPELADTRDATASTVERAIAFIETNPDLNIGVADIARAAFVTPRAVQLAFRRQLDTTPTAYLRQVRLEHAREELTGADPARDTVTAIAARWGFTSSRFATLYREAFHEQPSDTLHR